MNHLRAFALRCVAAALLIVNRYEAGQRWGTRRSHLPGYVQDARFDIDQASRLEIVRKSRWCEKNSWIYQRLIHIFEQYVAGPNGLAILSDSSNPDWNIRSDEAFAASSRFADASSMMHLTILEAIAAVTWFVDGEAFLLKTRGEEKPYRPRVQLIETHRVATPSRLEGNRNVIDGIEMDNRGRRIAYWMRTGFNDDEFRRVPADQVIHLFEPSRPGQMRGLPLCYAVLNLLHDLLDLEQLEMDAAKDSAVKSTFIKTASGEVDPDQLMMNRFQHTTKTGTGTDVTENRIRFIKKEIGGRVAALRQGEDVSQFVSQRPSAAVQAYWEYLIGAICNGIGIPKVLVWAGSEKGQGTQIRSDLYLADSFFKSRSALLAEAFVEVRNYFIGWESQNNPEVADSLPKDWRKVVVLPPMSVNVDIGYNSDATLKELEAGTTTFREICARRGEHWQRVLRQKAIEAAFVRELAKEHNIDPSEISTRTIDRPERISTEPKNPEPAAAFTE